MTSSPTIRRSVLTAIVALTSLLASGLGSAQVKPLTAVQGRLITTRGDCPLLGVSGQERALSAETPYLLHTLQDKRLGGAAL